jgi:hypothetical protein
MALSMKANSLAPSVGSEDELMKAIDMAHARAAAVYANGAKTLVSEMAARGWEAWDASTENVTVADPDGLNDVDFLDLDCEGLAA